jgi:hypothetical protein
MFLWIYKSMLVKHTIFVYFSITDLVYMWPLRRVTLHLGLSVIVSAHISGLSTIITGPPLLL